MLPFKIKVDFRGEEVEKTMVINKWDGIATLAVHQAGKLARSKAEGLKYYIQTKIQDTKYYINDFGNKVLNLFKHGEPNAYDTDEEIRKSVSNATEDESEY